jgi:hypothetical protein
MSTPFVGATSHRHLALPGLGLPKAEKKRKDLYSNLPSQCLFCPFAVETLGSFGEEALQLVKELKGRLRSTTGDAREKAWLIQRSAFLFK